MTATWTLFADTGARLTRRYRPGRAPDGESRSWRGMCLESWTSAGRVEHIFADGADLLCDGLACIGPAAAGVAAAAAVGQVRQLLAEPVLDDAWLPAELDTALGALAAGNGVVLTWSGFSQRVAVGGPGRLVPDERALCTVEIADVEAPTCTEVVRWEPADVEASLRRVADAVDGVHSLAALPVGELPQGGCDVVLEPGRAGSFFHELLGHPLEADIVASGATYLAHRIGDRLAPSWLSVTDGAAQPGLGIEATVDDEGVPVTTVPLIERGRVAGTLSDRPTAALLGAPSSGHGRRVDYRHPVIPRMWHTTARVVDHRPDPPGTRRLAPHGLQLRWMNLLTGDFEFAIGAAVLDDGAGPARRVGPCLLAGNALTVLAALRPGAADVRGYGRASKGCGKLGQFPLVTTFANSGMWIPAEVVDVRDDHLG